MPNSRLDANISSLLGWLVTLISLLVCTLALHTRFPMMTLMGLSPNWLLIWLVAWSLKRPVFLAAIAGASLGFIQDALTIPSDAIEAPTHAIGMAMVGALTALLQKQRYMQEDFVSVALIVFGMAVISETAIALQMSFFTQNMNELWLLQQRITLGSAILSSLWSPVVHLPLSRFWRSLEN